MTQHQAQVSGDLPPLPSPTAEAGQRAEAVVARMVARFGAPTIEHYRRVYAQAGAAWPGDDEVRRLHPVAPDAA